MKPWLSTRFRNKYTIVMAISKPILSSRLDNTIVRRLMNCWFLFLKIESTSVYFAVMWRKFDIGNWKTIFVMPLLICIHIEAHTHTHDGSHRIRSQGIGRSGAADVRKKTSRETKYPIRHRMVNKTAYEETYSETPQSILLIGIHREPSKSYNDSFCCCCWVILFP